MRDSLPLSSVLVARLGGEASGALEDALGALFRTGQQAWPAIPLTAQDFVAHLAHSLAAKAGADPAGANSPQPVGAALLDKINGRDLYLACACARGVPQALAAFESGYLVQVPVHIGHINRSPAFADEVCQVLRVNLLLQRDEQPPRISEYAGRGALHSWLRIAAIRVALRLSRKRIVDGQAEDFAVDRLLEPALGPELAHIKARYQPEFKAALQKALSALSSQHRNVLRLQVIGGLSGEQIATLYKVTRSTVSRWLSAARSEILAETQRLLQQRLQLSPAEFHSLAEVVQSQLDLSLSRVLTPEQDE